MRYNNQNVFVNKKEAYKRFLERTRGLKEINQFSTPKFKYPTQIDRQGFRSVNHVWSSADRYFKLADKYYGDPSMWWVIAFYNQKPTESHISLGDVIYVPIPLESILFYIGY